MTTQTPTQPAVVTGDVVVILGQLATPFAQRVDNQLHPFSND
ncbi:hypothetical protein SKC41_07155 [Mycobacterium sp. 050128]